MADPKVWGTTSTPSPEWGAVTRQVRVIVSAPSQRAALEVLAAHGMPVTMSTFRSYWARTGNPHELQAGAAYPNRALWANEGGGSILFVIPVKATP